MSDPVKPQTATETVEALAEMIDTGAPAPLRVGVAGLGTVGTATLQRMSSGADRLAAKAGVQMRVTAVSARDRTKDRGVSLEGVAWFDDPVALAAADIDIFVELIGGADGPAKAAVEAALSQGKAVVTANKALVARHGNALAALAEEHGGALHYEAAVAGGIPAVKALREGMTANEITRVSGILNGTCNYILTEMEQTGAAFGDVLAEAQRLGYAEADPEADIGGFDAAHKLAILSSIAFMQQVDFDSLDITGIEQVQAEDIQMAAQMGYRIRLVASAERDTDGIAQRVRPCLVPLAAPLAKVEGVTNAVVIEGDAVGQVVLTGPGAGGDATASAVIADIVDAARGNRPPALGVAKAALGPPTPAPEGTGHGTYYLRLTLQDRPGALAEITAALGAEGVSIHQMRQVGGSDRGAPVIIITHETTESALNAALARITNLAVNVQSPVSMRIESD